jgi:hypothetical protein
VAGVSEGMLEGLSQALQLDDAERAHLFDLARAASTRGTPRRQSSTKQEVRPGVQLALNAITRAPAFVGNGRLDILAANQLGYALYADMYVNPIRPANHARFVFLTMLPGLLSRLGPAPPQLGCSAPSKTRAF